MLKYLLIICWICTTTVVLGIKFSEMLPNLFSDMPQFPIERGNVVPRFDHFDAQNGRVFLQRIFLNGEFLVAQDPPIILYIAGDWENFESFEFLREGHIYDTAKELNLVLASIEVRYHRFSRPTPFLNTTSLRQLNTAQTLADIASYVNFLRGAAILQNSKVITVGTGYGGTLATLFRQRYPHLSLGAWASNAPLVGQFDLPAYFENAGKILNQIDSECYTSISRAFHELEILFSVGHSDEIENLLNLCAKPDANDQKSVATVNYVLANKIASFINSAKKSQIEEACVRIIEPAPIRIVALASWIFTQYNITCLETDYSKLIETLSDVDYNRHLHSERQQYYQQCSEFGWFRSITNSSAQPFGAHVPVEILSQICFDLFDLSSVRIRTVIDNRNMLYGGLKPDVQNVYFTHGEYNLYKSIGVTRDLNPSSPADVIPGYGINYEFGSIHESDSDELIAVKRRVVNLIREWIEN